MLPLHPFDPRLVVYIRQKYVEPAGLMSPFQTCAEMEAFNPQLIPLHIAVAGTQHSYFKLGLVIVFANNKKYSQSNHIDAKKREKGQRVRWKVGQSLSIRHFLGGNWTFKACVISSTEELRHFQAKAEHRHKMDAAAVMVVDSVISC